LGSGRYQARAASRRVPMTQKPSKMIRNRPLVEVGRNSLNIEKATGLPPIPNPRRLLRANIQPKLGAKQEANPKMEQHTATAR